MLGTGNDQAAGLRRLLGRRHARVVTTASGSAGVGKTTFVLNLAAAMAHEGDKVLLVDENAGIGNINDVLGLRARFDLAHALCGDRVLDEVLVEAGAGIQVLPATRLRSDLVRLDRAGHAVRGIGQLGRSADTVLVDTATGAMSRFVASAVGVADVVVVVSVGATAITQGYALIKLLARQFGGSGFRVAVMRARSEDEAHTVFDNLARVAAQRLELKLDFLGFVPHDPYVKRARELRRTVLDAYPQSPAARAFRSLAMQLGTVPRTAGDGGGREGLLERLLTTLAPSGPLAPQTAVQ